MLIVHANVFQDGAFRKNQSVRIGNSLVQEISQGLTALPGERVLDADGGFLLPGFVDVHIHGSDGFDTMRGERDVRAIARFLRSMGVAAFLPTTVSTPFEQTVRTIRAVRAVMDRPEPGEAAVLGMHMEAPFLQKQKCGAQRSEFFLKPSMQALMDWTDGRPEKTIRMITVAPELNGAEEFIRAAAALGIHIAIGHTSANAEMTHRAADWGADHVTHLFNAQTPLHHREPGAPGAALADERLYCEMICDGIHLHPDIIKIIARAKGPGRALAVTDAMEAAGMPDGEYDLGGAKVFVSNKEARLASGALAGSVLTMPEAFKNLIRFGIDPRDAARMCTQTPADSVGEERFGRLRSGLPLPLTLWNRGWSAWQTIDE